MENIVFGIRPILEAIRAGKNIDKILISEKLIGELSKELFAEIRNNKITTQYVPPEKINKLCTKNHQGVIAYISPIEYYDIEKLIQQSKEEGKNILLVVLDGVTDVRNFGAIARSCECAAVTGIILPKHGSVKINDEAIKTSAGALFNIPVSKVDNLTDTVYLLKQYDIQIVAANEKADKIIYDCDFKKDTAVILGSENIGISKQLLKNADILAKIPIQGKTNSLNVSVSAAVFLFESIRQRFYKM